MNESTGAVLGLSSSALFVLLFVWYALALSAVFAKTGVARWEAWVPVLNAAMILKLGGFSPWLVLLNLVPLFGFIAFIVVFLVAVHRITVGFGYGAGMTVLGALVQVAWASVLGFGAARWSDPASERSRPFAPEPAPLRRGEDFAGPHVPRVGGWTPEPATGTRAAANDAVQAESVVQPFAAPSTSLSDALPSPVVVPGSETPRPPSSGARLAGPDDSSIFDVLEELRSASRATAGEGASRPVHARADGAQPTLPLTPALPTRARGSRRSDFSSPASDAPAPVAAASPPSPVEPEDPAEVPASSSSPRAQRTFVVPQPPAPQPVPEREETALIADVPLTRRAAGDAPQPPAITETDGEEFPEWSEAVSAVPEAPDAGAPRPARTSVAALYTHPAFPVDADRDDDGDADAGLFEALDRTVVARRRRVPWVLTAPNGEAVDLTSSVVIIGRRPVGDHAFPDAQLVSIGDETRTVSKTHARLELRGETWFVTDLNSTNGVLFATLMGTEIEAPPGEEIEAGERFFLGDAEVRLSRRPA